MKRTPAKYYYEVAALPNLKYLAGELGRLVELHEHYRTGTVKELARDVAIKIAKELSRPFELEVKIKP